MDKAAQLEARKDTTKSIRESRWYDLRRKIWDRWIEGGIVEKKAQRLRQAMIANGTSFLKMGDLTKNSAEIAEQKRKQDEENKAVVKRMQKGQLIGAQNQERGEKILEIDGSLKTELIGLIYGGIIRGEITDQNQQTLIREKLVGFIRAHEDDPRVQAIFGRENSLYGEAAEMFATNLWENGRILKEHVERTGEGLDRLEDQIQVKFALAKIGRASCRERVYVLV